MRFPKLVCVPQRGMSAIDNPSKNHCETDQQKTDSVSAAMAEAFWKIEQFRTTYDADLLFLSGPLHYDIYWQLHSYTEKEKQRSNLFLILGTLGGDAHAAFRIARCLGQRYDTVTVIIPGTCKSAGTLLALGANDLVISDSGELGPLDIQLRKPDEMMGYNSGLDTKQALDYLADGAMSSFRNFMLEIFIGAQVGTKMAASIATEMTTGLFGRIYEQIDPVKLGEVIRATNVATEYGERLSKNLKHGALDRLVNHYPAHGFVIDLEEAKTLFKSVRAPTDDEKSLLQLISAFGLMDKLREPDDRVTEFGIIRAPSDGAPNAEEGNLRSDEGSAGDNHPRNVSEPDAVREADQANPIGVPQNGCL